MCDAMLRTSTVIAMSKPMIDYQYFHVRTNRCGIKKKCVKKHALKRTTLIVQRAQSVTNGYFGGYIGKRQLTGKPEVRKCMEKMQRVRMKIVTRSHASQVRAASGFLFHGCIG